MQTELDVVNDCLSTLGELPVNSLDDDHNLVAAARRAFRKCNSKEQARKWWFNTEKVHLVRDTSGFIFTPADSLMCTPIDPSKPLMQRGRRLYDTGIGANPAGYNMVDASLDVWITREIPFDDLPPSMQELVSIATQVRFMLAFDADSLRLQQAQREYIDAYSTANAEHIRNSKTSLLEKPVTLARLIAIGGLNSARLSTPGRL